jgi:hypothetical protein
MGAPGCFRAVPSCSLEIFQWKSRSSPGLRIVRPPSICSISRSWGQIVLRGSRNQFWKLVGENLWSLRLCHLYHLYHLYHFMSMPR